MHLLLQRKLQVTGTSLCELTAGKLFLILGQKTLLIIILGLLDISVRLPLVFSPFHQHLQPSNTCKVISLPHSPAPEARFM